MFYDIYMELCREQKKDPYSVPLKIGYKSNSVVAQWKDGSTPRGKYLDALAEYFGVTKQRLLGLENEEQPTIPHAQFREILSEGGIRLLLDEDANVPDENIEDIIKYIKLRQGQVGR